MPEIYRFHPEALPAFDLLAWFNLIGAAGCAFWIATYLFVIRAGQRDQACGMPTVAVILNFSWELMAVALLPKNPVPLWHWFNVGWLGLDCVILWQLLRYGPRFQGVPELKRHFRLLVAGGLLLALSGQYAFAATVEDRLGILAAFSINLVMSIAFIALFFARRERREGLSLGAALCKLLGTVGTNIECHVVCSYIDPQLPRLWFLTWIGIAIFLFDATYVVLLWRAQASAARR